MGPCPVPNTILQRPCRFPLQHEVAFDLCCVTLGFGDVFRGPKFERTAVARWSVSLRGKSYLGSCRVSTNQFES
jgi:hypothetical protein